MRAYSGAVQEGLAASTVIEKTSRNLYGSGYGLYRDRKDPVYCRRKKLPILDSEYTDKVVLKLLVPEDQVEEVDKSNHRRNKWKSPDEESRTVFGVYGGE